MIDLQDPQTFWLNVTNIGLGLATIACFGLVAWAIVHELVRRLVERRSEAELDAHAFLVPGLGTTMADGGEPVKPKTTRTDTASREE